jgi:hypothetical protein
MSKRAQIVTRLAQVAAMRPGTLWDGLAQVGVIAAYWPELRSDERRKIRSASLRLDGLIERRRCRKTRTWVGIYRSAEAGIETDPDPELRYSLVCEDHGSVVCVGSVQRARQEASDSTGWCDDCRNGGG